MAYTQDVGSAPRRAQSYTCTGQALYPKKKPPRFTGALIGPAQVVKSLQRVVGATVDGIVSGQTVAAVDIYKGDLIAAYADEACGSCVH